MLSPVGNVTRSQRPGTPARAAAGTCARSASERESAMRNRIAAHPLRTSAAEQRLRLLDDVVDVEAELVEGLRTRRGGAEAVQRDRVVDPLRPAHLHAGLDGELWHAGREHRGAVVVFLAREPLPR